MYSIVDYYKYHDVTHNKKFQQMGISLEKL